MRKRKYTRKLTHLTASMRVMMERLAEGDRLFVMEGDDGAFWYGEPGHRNPNTLTVKGLIRRGLVKQNETGLGYFVELAEEE